METGGGNPGRLTGLAVRLYRSLVYRRGGIVAIGTGLVLALLFLLWPVRIQTGYVRSRGDVSRVYAACGIPYSILADRQFGDEARTPWIREQCVLASRTRLINIGFFSGLLLAFGIAGVLRGPYRRVPLTDVLRPLPKRHWWQRRRVD